MPSTGMLEQRLEEYRVVKDGENRGVERLMKRTANIRPMSVLRSNHRLTRHQRWRNIQGEWKVGGCRKLVEGPAEVAPFLTEGLVVLGHL